MSTATYNGRPVEVVVKYQDSRTDPIWMVTFIGDITPFRDALVFASQIEVRP